MNAIDSELLLKDEVYRIVGCAITVLNTLGHGLLEKPYENALVVEFKAQGIPISQQRRFEIRYRNVHVGEYIPDLIAFDSVIIEVIIETKTVDHISDIERGQVINYLRIRGLRVGVILNFKHARLEWERIVL